MASELTLTCEDNMAMMARYPDKYFDLAIVDPPYGIGMDGNAGKSKNNKKKSWDLKSPDLGYFVELNRISKNQIIWGANHFMNKIPYSASPCYLIWDKREELIPQRTFSDAEIAYTSFNYPVRVFRHYWDGFLQKVKEERTHPTQKPIALYKWLLKNYAKEGDKILDTHLGSMSIAIACYDMGFDLTGCELDPDYYQQGMKRVENHKKQLTIFG